MIVNKDTVIRLTGNAAVLVPYEEAHVKVYHEWMGDPELLRLTCSDRLSLEEEFKNMKSWRTDPNKLTFIILDASRQNAMAGDVNLYLNGEDGEGEIEVMVAEPESRRRGIAKSSLLMMMIYASETIGVFRFIAKILDDNVPSLKLFEKLSFKKVRHVKAFKETHFVLDLKENGSLTGVQDAKSSLVLQSIEHSGLHKST